MNDVKEKAKAFLGKAKERLKKISKKVWIAIAAVLVVLIVATAVVLTLNKEEYAVLITQVSNSEAADVLTFLTEQGVTDYKMEDGNTILVPESQETALKARLLMANLTETGSYYMENLSAFSTNEERSYADRRDLEMKMAGVIRTFDNVIDATVNITPGENRAYILDSGNVVKASAAVKVTMMEGKMLSDGQAQAIQEFVAHSVQGLEIESVSIVDSVGNIYLTGDALNGDASALKMQFQQAMENRIRTNVMNVLSPFFGEDNVRVGVTCEVEVNRTTEERNETILPPYAQDGSTDGRGIVGSEHQEGFVGRPGDNPAGGIPGTETNGDLPEYVEGLLDPQDGDNSIYANKQIDYDNSHSVINIDNNGAVKMTDCSVAVSVNARTAGDFNISDIQRHTAKAAGITGEMDPITGEEILDNKISVVSMEFYDPTINNGGPGGEKGEGQSVPLWVFIAAGAGLLLFIILLTVILLMRRKKRKKLEAQQEQERREMEAMLAAAGLSEEGEAEAQAGADVMDLELERSMELRKDIRQFVSDNPEIAAQMIKIWLKGGDDNG